MQLIDSSRPFGSRSPQASHPSRIDVGVGDLGVVRRRVRTKPDGGEGGIRTLDTVLPVYHISSVVLSATQPPLLGTRKYRVGFPNVKGIYRYT